MKTTPIVLRGTHIGCLLLSLGMVLGACQQIQPRRPPTPARPGSSQLTAAPTPAGLSPSESTPSIPGGQVSPPSTSRGRLAFAIFQEPAYESGMGTPHEPIAPDLSNVRVSLVLSQEQLQRLGRDGLVVGPGVEKEFFTLYEKARYNNEPIFVTSDSLLHVYHLLFDKVLRTAEVEHFIPMLADLNQALLAQTDAQYQALRNTSWEEAAIRTVAFVGVATRLLDPQAQVPAYAEQLVAAELALIDRAEGILPSPLFPGLELGEDYTQYIPRGHYTRRDDLRAYFKSMMWYGRMTFRLKTDDPEVGKAETRSALLLVQALREAAVGGQPALEVWEALYSPTAFFVGRSDDLTPHQYLEVLDQVYGPTPTVQSLADEGRLEAFIREAEKLPAPKILGLVIFDTDDIEETTKGLRFMGQRFVPDAYIFRQLIYRNVGTRDNRRGLPNGLDIPAAMGSERAYQLLDALGETRYENYPVQMAKMRRWLAGLTPADWTETLYNAWLYTFYPLLEVPGTGYPAFMQSPAWLDKQLNTSLGSWAELKHDTILYAKQVYAEMGGGPPPPPPLPPRGYVEPVPAFYARLRGLTAMTRTGLETRGLLSELDRSSLARLEELAEALQTMAEKELSGEPLSDSEYEIIRFYGGELEHLTMAAADTDTEDPFAPRYMDEEPQAAVIADVATDPAHVLDDVVTPAVLEVAVGRVNPIFVVVPIHLADGSRYLQVAKGGVFSYYEFPWPASDRLTDEKWRQKLADDLAPPLPSWTAGFYSSATEYAGLGGAILEFQKNVTGAFWDPPFFLDREILAVQMNRPALETLVAQRQYVSHQLLRTQVRSFDLQSPGLAVVAVREFWQDSLHTYPGDFPRYDEPATATRAPYPLDVTYTLETGGGVGDTTWQVTRAVYVTGPPPWE